MKDLFSIGNTVFSITEMSASQTIAVSILALVIFIMFYHVAQLILDAISSTIIVTIKTIKNILDKDDEIIVTVDSISNPNPTPRKIKPMAVLNENTITPSRKTVFKSTNTQLDEKTFSIPAYARKEQGISYPIEMK